MVSLCAVNQPGRSTADGSSPQHCHRDRGRDGGPSNRPAPQALVRRNGVYSNLLQREVSRLSTQAA